MREVDGPGVGIEGGASAWNEPLVSVVPDENLSLIEYVSKRYRCSATSEFYYIINLPDMQDTTFTCMNYESKSKKWYK